MKKVAGLTYAKNCNIMINKKVLVLNNPPEIENIWPFNNNVYTDLLTLIHEVIT